VPVYLPAPTSGVNQFSLKCYADVDGRTGIFDGTGANKIETGTYLYDFTVLAPQNAMRITVTTTTTTTTTTSTSTTTSTTTSSTTT
jgi:hypothetical protein